MKNRFSKIIRPEDGRCVMLAVDHGYFLGPTEKRENPMETIKPLLPHADSIMLTRGILRTSVSPESNVPIVLRVSGGSSIIGEDSVKGNTRYLNRGFNKIECLMFSHVYFCRKQI